MRLIDTYLIYIFFKSLYKKYLVLEGKLNKERSKWMKTNRLEYLTRMIFFNNLVVIQIDILTGINRIVTKIQIKDKVVNKYNINKFLPVIK